MRISDWLYTKAAPYASRMGIRTGTNFGGFAGSVTEIPDEEKSASAMHRAFYENRGTVVHKWRNYPAIYEKHLARFRSTPARILEIGVFQGGSLTMWRNYFGSSATIYGIDIDHRCKQYDGLCGSVRIGSQDDPDFLNSVVREMGGIDIVIDDGSHFADHQRASFNVLFPQLDSNGVYICEDTHSAYWRGVFAGGYRRKTNFIEFAKDLVDDLHTDFHGKPPALEDFARQVSGIHFYNSMIVFEKALQPRPSHMKVPPT